MKPLLKCQITIRTTSCTVKSLGLFRSTAYAVMVVTGQMNEHCHVKVEVIK